MIYSIASINYRYENQSNSNFFPDVFCVFRSVLFVVGVNLFIYPIFQFIHRRALLSFEFVCIFNSIFFRLYIVFLLFSAASSSPVDRHEREARSPANLVLLGAREGNHKAQARQDTQQLDLPAGEALDIFYR